VAASAGTRQQEEVSKLEPISTERTPTMWWTWGGTDLLYQITHSLTTMQLFLL